MGQDNSTPQNTEVLRYLEKRPELHEREVLEIKNMFDSLKPINGVVQLSDLEEAYKGSTEVETLRTKFGSKRWVTFDEFFDVVSSVILERRKSLKDVKCEANARQVSCFYCPYPSDTSSRRGRANHEPRQF